MKDFDRRLLYIFEKFQLNASSFADKIGVQRSSMSHILSGRNKPSLDFILKIYETFPEISLTWLTLGEGQFYKNSNPDSTLNSVIIEEVIDIKKGDEKLFQEMDLVNEQISNSEISQPIEAEIDHSKSNLIESSEEKISLPILNSDSDIEQILFFYKDGTFKSYRPK
ncbi:XRE family transcriptional regulator [Paenimyroides tangerinum]|uniref:XRE family transcriptional regulator n=1 Tax=Paenimyroides tangerinum TaxID=2488728 RepID=A0A3P3W814_9FLAO|nr:helix-turn-helix transcriptional regulator [Paenimyroides tangerinum]RRJ91302.1 XRE family transcriptional regulator [Paenimyroides tangerinum]